MLLFTLVVHALWLFTWVDFRQNWRIDFPGNRILVQILLKFVSKGPVNSESALVQIITRRRTCRRQCIIWTTDGLVFWCINAPPDLDELITPLQVILRVVSVYCVNWCRRPGSPSKLLLRYQWVNTTWPCEVVLTHWSLITSVTLSGLFCVQSNYLRLHGLWPVLHQASHPSKCWLIVNWIKELILKMSSSKWNWHHLI